MEYILQNVRAITLSDDRSFLDNVDIHVKNGTIERIGDLSEVKDIKRYDMKRKVALPGIVNGHMHFYSTLGRGLAMGGSPPENFVEVLKKFWWKLDYELSRDELYHSVAFPLIEGIKHGVTTIFDHHVSTGFIKSSLVGIKNIMDDYGIKGTLSFEVSNRNGQDIFKKDVE